MAEALTEYLNDESKIHALVNSYHQKRTAAAEIADPDKIIPANEQLPIDDMLIGQIPEEYLTQATVREPIDINQIGLPKVAYLHSDIETLERSDILADLRRGVHDVVVGINLLREGLDLPEVTLVAVLDADKEGFLRSRSSLIQTMGRAARHTDGKAILYADKLTISMKEAIQETNRRREIQLVYNQKHGITPQTIIKPIRERMIEKKEESKEEKEARSKKGTVVYFNKTDFIDIDTINADELTPADKKILIPKLKRRMNQAANEMDFELAALLRDKVTELS